MVNKFSDGFSNPPARVLVLDDHHLSRRYTVAALRQAGLAVKAAAAPRAALRTALAWLPHAVVVDIELPGCDGWTWMNALLAAWPGERPRPRLVVLTGRVVRPPPSAPTPDAVLRKPASPDTLRAALRESGDAVREDSAAPCGQVANRALAPLFRRELVRSLEDLDRLLVGGDLGRAGVVVHRLVASSRICGEPVLEARLEALQAACAGGAAHAPTVARAYFGVLAGAKRLLDPAARASG